MSSLESKCSKANTEMNINAIKASLSPGIIKCYSGNASNNANDSRKESKDTFNQLLTVHRLEHGLVPMPIIIYDLFHADNLEVTHASVAAFGDTEINYHRKRHHRQLLQRTNYLFVLEKLKNQMLMKKLRGNFSDTVPSNTMRRRVLPRSCVKVSSGKHHF